MKPKSSTKLTMLKQALGFINKSIGKDLRTGLPWLRFSRLSRNNLQKAIKDLEAKG